MVLDQEQHIVFAISTTSVLVLLLPFSGVLQVGGSSMPRGRITTLYFRSLVLSGPTANSGGGPSNPWPSIDANLGNYTSLLWNFGVVR